MRHAPAPGPLRLVRHTDHEASIGLGATRLHQGRRRATREAPGLVFGLRVEARRWGVHPNEALQPTGACWSRWVVRLAACSQLPVVSRLVGRSPAAELTRYTATGIG
jgi:hypothetical protein